MDASRPLQGFKGTYEAAPGTAFIVLKVFAENTRVALDRQAVLKLINRANQSVLWQTTENTEDDPQGLAQGVFPNVPFGDYDLEVSAVGYLSEKKQFELANRIRPLEMEVVLHKDPSAANLDVGGALPAKARKETKKAVTALKSGKLDAAQKQLDGAYRLAPTSSDLNFLLGYLFFEKRDLAKAASYLDAATSLSPHNTQAEILLGRVGLARKDYPVARSALERAVADDAGNWLPRNLLADTYLQQHNYEGAREQAQLAIEQSKGKANNAHLVLGQALLGLGRDQEGIQELTTFLHDEPATPLADQIKAVIAQAGNRELANGNPSHAEASLTGVDPLAGLPAPKLPVTTWQPPGIDDDHFSVAADVTCPTEKVIDEAGEKVKQLVDNMSRFAAVEDLLHQQLDDIGNPIETETRKFNYIASISESSGGLSVDEFRADKLGTAGYPDQIASSGFATLALVFHPLMRDDFDMKCEGLGDWQGQATWLVHFRQRDDRPSRIHSYRIGSNVYAIGLKGRAWIAANSFQVVRIESELVSPQPQIRLLSEHQIVLYGPVPFAKKNLELWLPKSAEIYFDLRKHRYYRRHSFDHYMLFSVDATDKPKEIGSATQPQ